MAWDHPRGCGAHNYQEGWCYITKGSSPRVRGSHSLLGKGRHGRGIIPAGAGLTSPKLTVDTTARDHPRGCGAHLVQLYSRSRCRGSSPRVRGSLCLTIDGHAMDGIIPAGAGLTTAGSWRCRRTWDHPRGCGAHPSGIIAMTRPPGSSPRVRGSRKPD